jgi:hypothetical protein
VVILDGDISKNELILVKTFEKTGYHKKYLDYSDKIKYVPL